MTTDLNILETIKPIADLTTAAKRNQEANHSKEMIDLITSSIISQILSLGQIPKANLSKEITDQITGQKEYL